MDTAELLAAFEAFVAGLGIEPKDLPKVLGQFKTCGCSGSGISCGDIATCIKNAFNLEAIECPAPLATALVAADGTIKASTGPALTATALAPGSFEIEGPAGVEWWQITPQPQPDESLCYALIGWGCKRVYVEIGG